MAASTISEAVRHHALGPIGGVPFTCVMNDRVWNALNRYRLRSERSLDLTPEERRMFALFVAEAEENP